MSQVMDWNKLLSKTRLGENLKPKNELTGFKEIVTRSAFERDYDRIIFSSAFRRLQDKAQVFPLAENDYIRTRLTHSLESASVGRSLGFLAGVFICDKFKLQNMFANEIGSVVSAACLAHDIGNSPLGHSGEEAVRHWFSTSKVAQDMRLEMSENEINDILYYEGNAQGFRVLTKLQMPDNIGGMQLCAATLGSFLKYPCFSSSASFGYGGNNQKFSVFKSEQEFFIELAEHLNLVRFSDDCYCRHPLAFLVEAADDICYRIIDFEDAYSLKIIDYEMVYDSFNDIIQDTSIDNRLVHFSSRDQRVEYLRARVLNVLVEQCSKVFEENIDDIMRGDFTEDITKLIPSSDPLKAIYDYSKENIYTDRRAVDINVAGFELTTNLLDIFMTAVNDYATAKVESEKPNFYTKTLLHLIPQKYRVESEEWFESSYIRLMNIIDFISGMTDSYAVSIYKKVKGISISKN
ncbi:deoxyguanosinetriphosphate triphosphohydrolase [Lentisphaerota bacterium WC36G]|nr:deoxyguanosinetriphosphate triphosphohydrolase [Lentisphaerae bacterium WC36]